MSSVILMNFYFLKWCKEPMLSCTYKKNRTMIEIQFIPTLSNYLLFNYIHLVTFTEERGHLFTFGFVKKCII